MMIFCPRNTRKARKYSYSYQDFINTKITLTLERRLRLLWQAKLALRSHPAKALAGNANCSRSHALRENAVKARCAASHEQRIRDAARPALHSHAARGNEGYNGLAQTLFFMPFLDKYPLSR